MSRLPCKEHLKGTCTNPSCEKWHSPECLFYSTKARCTSYAHRQLEEQPGKKPVKNGDNSAVAIEKDARQLVCVFQDMEPPRSSSILWKSSNILKPIRCVQFTKAVLRHANIRDQKPSLGIICSQDETEWQERCAREAAWKLAKNILKLKEKHVPKIGVSLNHRKLYRRKESLS